MIAEYFPSPFAAAEAAAREHGHTVDDFLNEEVLFDGVSYTPVPILRERLYTWCDNYGVPRLSEQLLSWTLRNYEIPVAYPSDSSEPVYIGIRSSAYAALITSYIGHVS